MNDEQPRALLVRTKTGNRLHVASRGSSRTWCGAKVAMHVKALHPASHVEGCGGCGIAETATITLIERFLSK